MNSNTTKVVTEATLMEIPYHNLKVELGKLGLGSAWKGGEKRTEIIKKALAVYSEVQRLQEINVPQEDIDERLRIKAEADAEKAETERLEKRRTREEEEKAETEKTKEKAKDSETKQYDIPKLYNSLKLTRANIKGGPQSHIIIHRKREQLLITMLQEAGEKIE